MKVIVFDSGPLISLTMTNLLWILDLLKKRSGKEFLIVPDVKYEIIDRPLQTKRFAFEALQIQELINKGTLRIENSKKVLVFAEELLALVNGIFESDGQPLHIVDRAEMETLSAAILLDAEAVVVDERITRYLVEDPHAVRSILENRLHKRVSFNDSILHKLEEKIYSIRIIRSTELAARCVELGLLDRFISQNKRESQLLLHSVLWKLKLSGAAISEREIEDYQHLIKKKMSTVSSA